MIERVSKAILETPNTSDYERLVAINAIKAMREPTEKMVIAAPGHSNIRKTYQAMLDAIIND